jgi:putative endonuclease
VSGLPQLADSRGRLGRRGEAAAEALLRRAGMRILERRFRVRCGEIDLIAEQDGRIVFVEVKARRGTGYGIPAAAITKSKRERIARVALAYLQRRSWLNRPTRFDVVEVLAGPGQKVETCHIEDAFRLWPTG